MAKPRFRAAHAQTRNTVALGDAARDRAGVVARAGARAVASVSDGGQSQQRARRSDRNRIDGAAHDVDHRRGGSRSFGGVGAGGIECVDGRAVAYGRADARRHCARARVRRIRRPPERPRGREAESAVARGDDRHARVVSRARLRAAWRSGSGRLSAGLHGIRHGHASATFIPLPFVIVIVCAVLFTVLLQATAFGRSLYAIGANSTAAAFSGIEVAKIRLWSFVLSGAMSALAGIVYTLRFTSARGDNGEGFDCR